VERWVLRRLVASAPSGSTGAALYILNDAPTEKSMVVSDVQLLADEIERGLRGNLTEEELRRYLADLVVWVRTRSDRGDDGA
jgi:hypothetical protein